jgi:Xaa-Pro aminopeptidase
MPIENKAGGDLDFLGFEHVTWVPIQRTLIDLSLLNSEQHHWIDAYHTDCRQLVSPYLELNSPGWHWLQRETKPLIDAHPSKRLKLDVSE